MLRKPVVLCLFALALFLVLPSLAMAENSPASNLTCGNRAAAPTNAAPANAAPAFFADQALEPEELPGDAEKPIPAACPDKIYKCVKCTINTVKICEYWTCSGTLIGCYPCSNHC